MGSNNYTFKYPVEFEHSYTGDLCCGERKLKLPPLEVLDFMFQYDSESGILYRIRRSDGKEVIPPKPIGSNDGNYLIVSIADSSHKAKTFKVHQICYFMYHRVEPLGMIDHYDGIGINNKILNLREVTNTLSARNLGMRKNNRSGVTGIFWSKKLQKWRAECRNDNGIKTHVGVFTDIEEAKEALSTYRSTLTTYGETHGLVRT